MVKRLFLVAALCLFAVAGCSTKYDLGASGKGAKLDRGQRVCIITPADGNYEGRVYTGSGAATANLLQGAIARYTAGIERIPSQGSLQADLGMAANGGYRYVFYPQIINWEPRAAAWSGRPTRVNVLMIVYDMKAGQRAVIQENLDVRGRIMTFVSQSPPEILKPLFEQFAASSF